jgi:hypothetical protein
MGCALSVIQSCGCTGSNDENEKDPFQSFLNDDRLATYPKVRGLFGHHLIQAVAPLRNDKILLTVNNVEDLRTVADHLRKVVGDDYIFEYFVYDYNTGQK